MFIAGKQAFLGNSVLQFQRKLFQSMYACFLIYSSVKVGVEMKTFTDFISLSSYN